MSDNLLDLEAIQPSLANWADRVQADVDLLNADTQRRCLVTLGETVPAYSTAYVLAADGKAYKAKGSTGMLPAIGLANEGGIANDQIRLVTFGVMTNSAWTWTPQSLLVLSTATAGQLVQATLPLVIGPQQFVQVMAVALSATKIFICPSLPFLLDFRDGAYTVATKPVGSFVGQQIFIIDAGTTGRMAYWAVDGYWRYTKDDTAV